jgi:cullin-associated NEDD8-dissociated protein 1
LLFIYLFLFFAEREENVKNDIFHAYISLLRQTRPVVSSSTDPMETEEGFVAFV